MRSRRTDLPPGDPMPTAPVRPDVEDCCRSGCDPCVFDLHAKAVERHRIELAAWRLRHAHDLPEGIDTTIEREPDRI